ncbi:hypothetical protein ACEQ8H_006406 [Pleosporales sp. CAS-2024a]
MAMMAHSNIRDAPCRSFPFLRLPSELRLIVYDFMFSSVTRTHHESNDLSKSPQARHPCLIQRYGRPAASLVYVHESIPVAILATCRQIHAEAHSFARSALRALQERPKRIIVTTGAMDSNILDVFVRISESCRDDRGCIQLQDQRKDREYDGIEEEDAVSQDCQVQVAIRNEFENRPFGTHGTTEDLWSYLRLYMLRLHYDRVLYEAHELLSGEQWLPTRRLNVTFRMALMTQVEQAEFASEPWFENSVLYDGKFRLQIQGGTEIESDEWDKEWATSVPCPDRVVERSEEEWASFLPISVRIANGIGVSQAVASEQGKRRFRVGGLLPRVSGWWKKTRKRWSDRRRPA